MAAQRRRPHRRSREAPEWWKLMCWRLATRGQRHFSVKRICDLAGQWRNEIDRFSRQASSALLAPKRLTHIAWSRGTLAKALGPQGLAIGSATGIRTGPIGKRVTERPAAYDMHIAGGDPDKCRKAHGLPWPSTAFRVHAHGILCEKPPIYPIPHETEDPEVLLRILLMAG